MAKPKVDYEQLTHPSLVTKSSVPDELLHVYPTMAEALKIAAISRRKDPAKLSC